MWMALPKSPNFTVLSFATKKFDGFISKWMKPFLWTWEIERAISAKMRHISFSGRRMPPAKLALSLLFGLLLLSTMLWYDMPDWLESPRRSISWLGLSKEAYISESLRSGSESYIYASSVMFFGVIIQSLEFSSSFDSSSLCSVQKVTSFIGLISLLLLPTVFELGCCFFFFF